MTAVLLVWGAPALAGVELGLGGAAGGAFYEPELGRRDVHGAASPVLSVQLDPWRGVVRPVLGLTSAPTFSYSMGYDAYTAPVAVVDAGLLVGGPYSHVGLTGHAGLISFGASARATMMPWSLGAKARTGLELRATWLARWGGFGAALWTVRLGA